MRRDSSWTGFHAVLCAVDFSEQSSLALQYAAAVARRGAGSLLTLHVADPLLAAAASAALHDRELAERSERDLCRFADACLAVESPPAFTRSERVVIGEAADQILAVAGEAGADLIVLGTAGLTAAERFIIGSTTLKVLQRSRVPVLAVPRADRDAMLPSAGWPGGRVLVVVDVDDPTAEELQIAGDVAAWFHASLTIADAAPGNRSGDAASRLRELALEVPWTRTARVEADGGDIGAGVAALTAAERAGLVVMMLRERKGWFGAQRGSVPYNVVTASSVPVLALPAGTVER
jgi:nucleotide-binding universal stress UspA family protein